MEKFMLIFHGGINPASSAAYMQENMGKWMAWVNKLKSGGIYESGEPLLPGGKVVSGVKTVTDGPFTEGKEVVGGYFIINAKNYEEAVSLCADYPDFKDGGTIQIRQVMKIPM